jgi:hypothetical protein
LDHTRTQKNIHVKKQPQNNIHEKSPLQAALEEPSEQWKASAEGMHQSQQLSQML